MANQTWITYFEPISSAKYTFHTKTLTTSQQERLSLTTFLLTTGHHPSSKAHVDFLIKSDSLKTPVLLPNSKALTAIYQQHCKNDPVITIIIRPSNDPTPSSSHDAGAIYSFLERIKVNGLMWNASGAIEPERRKHLVKIASAYPSFENNAKKFIQDLAVSHADWATDVAKRIARRRLSCVPKVFYLGFPYFCEQAVRDILDIPVQCYTLRDVLDVVARQAARGCKDEHAACELCTLVPLFVYVFGFTWVDVADWGIPLQEIDTGRRPEKNSLQKTDTGKRPGKIHGRVCRMKKRLRRW